MMARQRIDSLNITLELPEGMYRQDTPAGARFYFEAECRTRYMRCLSSEDPIGCIVAGPHHFKFWAYTQQREGTPEAMWVLAIIRTIRPTKRRRR
jgi:hypothetical protein